MFTTNLKLNAFFVQRGKENPILLQRDDPFANSMCVVVGDKYIVADCGGGTVDLTVHQIEQPQGTLKELYKASGELEDMAICLLLLRCITSQCRL